MSFAKLSCLEFRGEDQLEIEIQKSSLYVSFNATRLDEIPRQVGR